jgi:hypothetical protein
MVGFKFEKFGRDYGWKFISIAIDVMMATLSRNLICGSK